MWDAHTFLYDWCVTYLTWLIAEEVGNALQCMASAAKHSMLVQGVRGDSVWAASIHCRSHQTSYSWRTLPPSLGHPISRCQLRLATCDTLSEPL